MTGRRVRIALLSTSTLSLLLFAAGCAGLAESATAAWYPVPENGGAGLLTLSTDLDASTTMVVRPGERSYWQVEARLTSPSKGDIDIAVARAGALLAAANGAVVSVDVCGDEWSEVPEHPFCPSGGRRVMVTAPGDPSVSPDRRLGVLPDGNSYHLLVAVELPASAATDPEITNGRGALGLRFTAEESEAADLVVAASSAGPTAAVLGLTGADLLPLAIAAVGLIGAGGSLAALRRERRP